MTLFARLGQLCRPFPGTQRKRSAPRGFVSLEQLEDRLTPSVNPAGPLELDGNVTTMGIPSHDWDQVFADNNTSPPPVSGALASTFLSDAAKPGDDVFKGSSGDSQGLQQGPWLFATGNPQGKDDIGHAFAAAFTDAANGHLILYAGLDRLDNGSAVTAGFWFFKNPVSENLGEVSHGGHPFNGRHADGDLLLVSNLSSGGSTSAVQVYRWTGDDATGSLAPVELPADASLAIVNGAPISVPWAFTGKGGNTQPAAGEFLEEGVDLTELGQTGDFSSFLAETRSSPSPNAPRSDLVLGDFQLHAVQTSTTASKTVLDDSFLRPSRVVGGVSEGWTVALRDGALSANAATGTTDAGSILLTHGAQITRGEPQRVDASPRGGPAGNSGRGASDPGTASLWQTSPSGDLAGCDTLSIANCSSETRTAGDSTGLNDAAMPRLDTNNLGRLPNDCAVRVIGP
jgi:hypothetical protein